MRFVSERRITSSSYSLCRDHYWSNLPEGLLTTALLHQIPHKNVSTFWPPVLQQCKIAANCFVFAGTSWYWRTSCATNLQCTRRSSSTWKPKGKPNISRKSTSVQWRTAKWAIPNPSIPTFFHDIFAFKHPPSLFVGWWCSSSVPGWTELNGLPSEKCRRPNKKRTI